MDLKILMVVIVYYTFISLLYGGMATIAPTYTTTTDLSSVGSINATDLDKGGFFGTGIDFGRYLLFLGFGLGFPADTPAWFSGFVFLWQTALTLFLAGWIIASIWNG